MEVSVGLYLDQRRVKANGKYPVKISVTTQRKTRYYSAELDATEEEFKQLLLSKPKPRLRHKGIFIQDKISDYRRLIAGLAEFSFEALEEVLFDGKSKKKVKTANLKSKKSTQTDHPIPELTPTHNEEDLVLWFDKTIKQYEEIEQVKTGEGYGHAKEVLIKYFNKTVLPTR